MHYRWHGANKQTKKNQNHTSNRSSITIESFTYCYRVSSIFRWYCSQHAFHLFPLFIHSQSFSFGLVRPVLSLLCSLIFVLAIGCCCCHCRTATIDHGVIIIVKWWLSLESLVVVCTVVFGLDALVMVLRRLIWQWVLGRV